MAEGPNRRTTTRITRLEEWWTARPQYWFAAPLLLLVGLLAWYLLIVRLPREAQWDDCQGLYLRATTARDTARVDAMRPPTGTKALEAEPCGVLRSQR